jgi:excisionase family DNA binding protein
MKQELIPQNQIKYQNNNYITTSRLAKLCGVSRFTIINWVKQNRIKSISTAGGHRRIPFSEVISCLETLHRKDESSPVKLFGYCWEFADLTDHNGKCRNCLINKRNAPYCFLLVREFGKDSIGCNGDCLTCGYFEKFFNKQEQADKPNKAECTDMDKQADKAKKNFLFSCSYNVGLGMRWIKRRIVDFMWFMDI